MVKRVLRINNSGKTFFRYKSCLIEPFIPQKIGKALQFTGKCCKIPISILMFHTNKGIGGIAPRFGFTENHLIGSFGQVWGSAQYPQVVWR
jgi:hypothetical protein